MKNSSNEGLFFILMSRASRCLVIGGFALWYTFYMATKELVDYIAARRADGFSDDKITTILQSAGYSTSDIKDALAVGKTAPAAVAVSTPVAQTPMASIAAVNSPTADPVVAAGGSSPSRRRPPVAAIIIAAAALLVIAGGASAYYFLVVANRPSPDQVMAEVIQNLPKMVSAETTQSLSIEAQIDYHPPQSPAAVPGAMAAMPNPLMAMAAGSGSSTFSLTANASGSFDNSDPQNHKSDEHLSFVLGGAAQNFMISAGAEVRLIGNTVYVRMENLPNLGFFDATPYENKWIQFGLSSSTQTFPMGQTLALPTTTFTAQDQSNIAAAVRESVKMTDTLPDGSVDGVPAYHFQYSIDQQGLKDLAHAFLAGLHTADASTTAQGEAAIDGFIDGLKSMGGDLWIGKDDYFIHQLSLNLNYATSSPTLDVAASVTATTTYTAINQPQDIVAPVGASDWSSILNTSLGGAYPNVMANTSDARRASDLYVAQNAAELYFQKCGYYPGGAIIGGICPRAPQRISTWSALTASLVGSGIVPSVPNDPVSGATYFYGTDAGAQNYIMAAKMESVTDSVFQGYIPLSLAGYRVTGLRSCAPPYYCLTL